MTLLAAGASLLRLILHDRELLALALLNDLAADLSAFDIRLADLQLICADQQDLVKFNSFSCFGRQLFYEDLSAFLSHGSAFHLFR